MIELPKIAQDKTIQPTADVKSELRVSSRPS